MHNGMLQVRGKLDPTVILRNIPPAVAVHVTLLPKATSWNPPLPVMSKKFEAENAENLAEVCLITFICLATDTLTD
jgi:hypothetical protein